MQPRKTAWLALAALALGVFIYWVEIRGGEAERLVEQSERRLFPELDVTTIDRLELRTSDDQEAVLVRQGDGFRLVAPIDDPADNAVVEGLLEGLAEFEREGSVKAANDLAAFGLGSDAPRLRFESGGTLTTIVMGRTTPLGTDAYVFVEGSTEVDYVASWRVSALRKRLGELRDARIMPFDAATIEAAQLVWPGGGVEVERRDGTWWMTSPIETLGDGATIDSLLSDLAYLRADDFVDDPEAGEDLGLAQPDFQLLADSKGAGDGVGSEVLEIVIGSATDADDEMRVAKGRDGHLFEIARSRLDAIPRNVVAYRDKSLARFEVADARSFEIVFAPEPGEADSVHVQAEFTGGGWQAQPEPMTADRAAAFIREIAHLDAVDILADALGPDELRGLGLDPPRISVRVWGVGESGASAPLLAALSFGVRQPGRGILAARPGEFTVYLIDDALRSDIPISVDELRASFLEPLPDQGGDTPDDLDLGRDNEIPLPGDTMGEIAEPEI